MPFNINCTRISSHLTSSHHAVSYKWFIESYKMQGLVCACNYSINGIRYIEPFSWKTPTGFQAFIRPIWYSEFLSLSLLFRWQLVRKSFRAFLLTYDFLDFILHLNIIHNCLFVLGGLYRVIHGAVVMPKIQQDLSDSDFAINLDIIVSLARIIFIV